MHDARGERWRPRLLQVRRQEEIMCAGSSTKITCSLAGRDYVCWQIDQDYYMFVGRKRLCVLAARPRLLHVRRQEEIMCAGRSTKITTCSSAGRDNVCWQLDQDYYRFVGRKR